MQAHVTKWLLEIAATSAPPAPSLDDPGTLRYGILYGYDALFDLLPSKNVMLTPAQQSKLQSTMAMLFEYCSRRAALSLRNSICNWRLKPESHMMKHLAEDAAESYVNPGVWWTFADESVVSQIARMALRTHRSTTVRSTVHRHMIRYHLRCIQGS